VERTLERVLEKRMPPPGTGEWIAGMAVGAVGMRRFRLYRPRGIPRAERLPLMVMLHGCGQDARSFALCTRMNRVADLQRFIVLYPEQDRIANAQGCWNWFETRSGKAQGEAALIVQAIDQACLLYGADPARVAAAGLSAGASMAALLAIHHPQRLKAVAMHSGVPPGTAHSKMSALGAMHGLRAPTPLPASPLPGPSAWPPLMVIHGTADPVVSTRNAYAAAQVWADAAGARTSDARSVRRGMRHPITITRFGPKGKAAATLVEVDGLGHAWSGGSPNQSFTDMRGPDASRMVWTFAARNFRA
jgi:poly(hydroxyalkanoate) depolymerase family esterase